MRRWARPLCRLRFTSGPLPLSRPGSRELIDSSGMGLYCEFGHALQLSSPQRREEKGRTLPRSHARPPRQSYSSPSRFSRLPGDYLLTRLKKAADDGEWNRDAKEVCQYINISEGGAWPPCVRYR